MPRDSSHLPKDGKLLAQLRPTDVPQVLYTPPAGKKATLTHIWLATFAPNVEVSVHHDVGGSTWDESNAWAYLVKSVLNAGYISLQLGNIRIDNGDTIGVHISSSLGATFSLYGYEEDV